MYLGIVNGGKSRDVAVMVEHGVHFDPAPFSGETPPGEKAQAQGTVTASRLWNLDLKRNLRRGVFVEGGRRTFRRKGLEKTQGESCRIGKD